MIYERLNPSTSPSTGIATASTELAAAADVAEADVQAKAKLVPDFWCEPPSVIHTPPARDIHEEVALQQMPLALAPEPVATPKRSRRMPETQPQQKPAAKAEGVKAKPRSRAKAQQ